MSRPYQFILASGNAHKAEEFNELLNPSVITTLAAPEKLDVIEDGKSFQANALLKAKAYFDHYQKPVLADDSGLVVSALPGELGIHSARFGGEGKSDQQRYELLLEKMKDQTDRAAYFVCLLCFYFSPDKIFFFEGRLQGSIGTEAIGEHGFGYDPVFIPSKLVGKSFAEDPHFKAKHSHRAVACQQAETFFKGFNETVDKS